MGNKNKKSMISNPFPWEKGEKYEYEMNQQETSLWKKYKHHSFLFFLQKYKYILIFLATLENYEFFIKCKVKFLKT